MLALGVTIPSESFLAETPARALLRGSQPA
jgi:hypothetical protein